MKKYIIYIGTIFLPDKNAAAQRALMICKSYRDIGKIPIVIGVNKDSNKCNNILETYTEYCGFDTYSMAYPQTNIDWVNRLYTIRPIVDIVNSYGVDNIHSIVVMDYMFIALWRLMHYCFEKDIRIVIDTVDWFNKSEYRFPKNKIKDFDTLIRMKFIHKRAEYMITISKYLYNYYKNQVTNIVMIPGTVDTNDEKWLKIEEYLGNDDLTIGYAGDPGERFEKERLDWLIKIVADLNSKGKRCKLVIAGLERNALLKNKPELLELKGLKGNVTFLGKIPHTECLKMIASCDFSVIIRENSILNKAGFPTKLSESLACGTPVIATPSGNVSDYITDNINGFMAEDCTYDSLNKLLKKIIELDKEQIFKMHYNTKQGNMLRYENYNQYIKQLVEEL